LAYLGDEPAAEQIEREWLSGGAAISAINLGEALYIRMRARGEDVAASEIATIRKVTTMIDADWDLIVAAAQVKARSGLSYADAFCVATAARLNAPLWTGDPEIIDRAERLPCEVKDLRSSTG
jgi:ribonuclease VapC